ncbi:MAG: DUF5916 domain-containing protein [Bacteroidales bacterium]|nr:DUF5916 domain-containing protein [Bacteroidales bacterium]
MKPVIICVFSVLWCLSAYSQEAVTVPKTVTPPVIDGILDDPAWQHAVKFTDFTAYMPTFNVPGSFPTTAMLTYDEENLYIAFDCRDPEPEKIKATISARDQIKSEDWVCINMDPFFDRQSMVDLYVNPLGIQADGRSSGSGEDAGADYVYYSLGKIDSQGYKVEIQVPFNSLRYRKKDPVMMGFILERRVQRLSEHSTWPALSTEQGINFRLQTYPFKFTGIRQQTLVELIPAVTYTHQKIHREGSLVTDMNNPSLSLTGKVGLTSQLMLDMAINPDFSQVESDAGQIDENQRYDLYFPEKRPFFQEGKENFDIAGISKWSYFQHVFHTRHVVNPLAAIKLSGKLNDNNRGALLYALDDPYKGSDSAAYRPSYIIGRYRYTIKGDSYIGAIATFKEATGEYNRVAGLDGRYRINPSTAIEFNLLGSSDQRTPEGGALNDWLGTLLFTKDNSKLSASLELQHIGTNFTSESGFLMRSGMNKALGMFTYNFYQSEGFFRRFSPNTFLFLNHDLPSLLWEIDFGAGFGIAGERSTQIDFFVNPCNEVYRGASFKTHNAQIEFRSQVVKNLHVATEYRFGYQTRYVENPYTGYGNRGALGLIYQPITKFQSELNLTYNDFYKLQAGGKDFSYLIIRSKNTFQVNPKLFFRAIVEYNSFERDVTLDLLASFTYIPGTVVHIGYGSLYRQVEWNGHEYQPGSDYLEFRRGFFFKASYLWRR